jgi:hypothetical protein
MLFNSLTFILGFLPITLGVFFLITKMRLIKLSIIWLRRFKSEVQPLKPAHPKDVASHSKNVLNTQHIA